jgi:secondary thiamine-phosphate synthase enzyme
MKSATEHLTMNTKRHRELVPLTDAVARFVEKSGIEEGMVLVSAMHITAGVFVNDDEPGLHQDIEDWLQRLAPGPAADDSRPGPDYRHHRGGEDNGDAHLKNLLVHHQVVVPVTDGRLDLGPWQAIFYCEFDGRRAKRLIIKVMGE